MAKKPKIPKNVAEVLKDRELLEKFETFNKKEHSLENFTFLTLKSWNAQNLYKIYLKKNAKYELNLPAAAVKQAHELAEKKAWDDRAWNKIYDDAQEHIVKMVQRDSFRRFVSDLENGKL